MEMFNRITGQTDEEGGREVGIQPDGHMERQIYTGADKGEFLCAYLS